MWQMYRLGQSGILQPRQLGGAVAPFGIGQWGTVYPVASASRITTNQLPGADLLVKVGG